MTSTIVHQPRVAWDAARALTWAAMADAATYSWCRDWVAALFGPELAAALAATRRQLTDPTTTPSAVQVQQVQQGLWRVRVEDALRRSPDLADELAARISDTRFRIA
jgi:hypothetical protein